MKLRGKILTSYMLVVLFSFIAVLFTSRVGNLITGCSMVSLNSLKSISGSLVIIMFITVLMGYFFSNMIIRSEDFSYSNILKGDLQRISKEKKMIERKAAGFIQRIDKISSLHKSELKSRINKEQQARLALINMMEDLTESFEKQKKLERIKTEFLSVTSHELRTPVTPMKAQLQMTLQGYFGRINKEQKKSLTMVLNNTIRLDRLIGDILDVSKLESGNMKFMMQKCDLNLAVTEAVETMKSKAEERGIKLVFIHEKVPQILMDKQRIIQVVINLINNAIKFTDAKGRIDVNVSCRNGTASVSVKDTGVGIKEEDQKRIFRPFMQVDSSRSRNYEGTGLGLAISKGIVEKHGGVISLKSKFGKGSLFEVRIPLKRDKHTNTPELFSVNKKGALAVFEKEIAKKGYVIVKSRSDELLTKYLTGEGRLKYMNSKKELLKLGLIRQTFKK